MILQLGDLHWAQLEGFSGLADCGQLQIRPGHLHLFSLTSESVFLPLESELIL